MYTAGRAGSMNWMAETWHRGATVHTADPSQPTPGRAHAPARPISHDAAAGIRRPL